MILRSHPDTAQEPQALVAGIRMGNTEVLEAIMSVGGTIFVREGAGFQQPGVLVTRWSAPLWWSCYFGRHDFVRHLLEEGGVASVHATDQQGLTMLHWCAVWGQEVHTEVASVLIAQKANVNARDKRGQTPLHWAARYGRKELMNLLTTHNADVEVVDDAGLSVREAATRSGGSLLVNEGEDMNFDHHDKLMDHFRSKGTPFFDKDFPPGLISLTQDVQKPPAAFREIQWLRLPEIAFGDGKEDTSVGLVGHAWFPATVGLAGHDGIDENFHGGHSGEGGVFCVKCVGKDMQEHHVVVDDLLPCIDGVPAFTSCSSKDHSRALIVEKAYAKLFGSYEALLGSWGASAAPEGAQGQEVPVTQFASARLSSIMCSPVGRRMKESGELSMAAISSHFAAQEMPRYSAPTHGSSFDTDASTNMVTAVGSSAVGCNPAYNVLTQKDAVLLVTVRASDDGPKLTGSLDVYSESGSSWIFVGSESCSQATHLELEVPIPAQGSPYVVLPSLGPDSGYALDIAATEEITVRPMSDPGQLTTSGHRS